MTKEGSDPLRPAVVLLSGGLDSATTLAIARDAGFACYCLSVDYGQRHVCELDAARRVATVLGATQHRVLRVDPATGFCGPSRCFAGKNGEAWYFDDDHPSLAGAGLIARRLPLTP